MYFGHFTSKQDVIQQFQLDASALDGCKMLFAAYDGDYEANALVVFRYKRKLYEVNGSHCSCYGLEDQWEPEETSVEALRHRVSEGTLGYFLGSYTAEFCRMLDTNLKGKRVRKDAV